MQNFFLKIWIISAKILWKFSKKNSAELLLFSVKKSQKNSQTLSLAPSVCETYETFFFLMKFKFSYFLKQLMQNYTKLSCTKGSKFLNSNQIRSLKNSTKIKKPKKFNLNETKKSNLPTNKIQNGTENFSDDFMIC